MASKGSKKMAKKKLTKSATSTGSRGGKKSKSLKSLVKTAKSVVSKLTASQAAKSKAKPVVVAPKSAQKITAVKATGKTQAKPVKAAKGTHVVVTRESSANTPLRTRRGGEKVPSGPICREAACELIATTGRYCRLHYIKNWKKIKRKELILKEGKLNNYIEELISKYPEKYIEAIRQDLASEKDFAKVIGELEIEGFVPEDYDTEAETVVEDIVDTAKREFDDDEDFF